MKQQTTALLTPEDCTRRRMALGLSREQLAVRAGVSDRTLRSFEDCVRVARHATLMAVLRALREAEATQGLD